MSKKEYFPIRRGFRKGQRLLLIFILFLALFLLTVKNCKVVELVVDPVWYETVVKDELFRFQLGLLKRGAVLRVTYQEELFHALLKQGGEAPAGLPGPEKPLAGNVVVFSPLFSHHRSFVEEYYFQDHTRRSGPGIVYFSDSPPNGDEGATLLTFNREEAFYIGGRESGRLLGQNFPGQTYIPLYRTAGRAPGPVQPAADREISAFKKGVQEAMALYVSDETPGSLHSYPGHGEGLKIIEIDLNGKDGEKKRLLEKMEKMADDEGIRLVALFGGEQNDPFLDRAAELGLYIITERLFWDISSPNFQETPLNRVLLSIEDDYVSGLRELLGPSQEIIYIKGVVQLNKHATIFE